MKILELSKSNSQSLLDPIRGEWVKASPEELVRQKILQDLISVLGFPKELIAVEKGLRQMPHLSLCPTAKIPSRRADIVCFAKNESPVSSLYPLLLIECKAVPITPLALRQIKGYNHYLNALYVALVNQTETRLGFFHPGKGEYIYTSQLLPFSQLSSMKKNFAFSNF